MGRFSGWVNKWGYLDMDLSRADREITPLPEKNLTVFPDPTIDHKGQEESYEIAKQPTDAWESIKFLGAAWARELAQNFIPVADWTFSSWYMPVYQHPSVVSSAVATPQQYANEPYNYSYPSQTSIEGMIMAQVNAQNSYIAYLQGKM